MTAVGNCSESTEGRCCCIVALSALTAFQKPIRQNFGDEEEEKKKTAQFLVKNRAN